MGTTSCVATGGGALCTGPMSVISDHDDDASDHDDLVDGDHNYII